MSPLLLHVFPSFTTGGVQRRFVAIANRWGRDFRHVIIAMDGVTDARSLLDPGLDVVFPAFTIRKGDTLGTVRTMRRLLHCLRPATLVTSNWGTIEWTISNRLPLDPFYVANGVDLVRFSPAKHAPDVPVIVSNIPPLAVYRVLGTSVLKFD